MDISPDDKKCLKAFEKNLGYRFKKREYLKRALTHKSYANEQKLAATEHNERYEYLGDAVLELAISHLLMQSFPDYPEGELSKIRAAVVNEEQLAELARKINLGDYLYLGKGEAQTGGNNKPSLLADAYEAVFGAVYLDRGFTKALSLVSTHYENVIKVAGNVGFLKDYKTRLQEESQSRYKAIPRYVLSSTSGPDHCKVFEVSLSIRGKVFSLGKGSSKKAAEQDAARQAFEVIETDETVLE